MKRNMRFLKKVISLAIVAALLVATPAYEALAAEELITVSPNIVVLEGTLLEQNEQQGSSIVPFSNTTISDASIIVAYSSEGMKIQINTSMSPPGAYVGVKDIKIQKKVFLGWETVATSEGGQNTNTSLSAYGILYTGAVKGETYRVSCTHYGYYNKYVEVKNVTAGYLCSY